MHDRPFHSQIDRAAATIAISNHFDAIQLLFEFIPPGKICCKQEFQQDSFIRFEIARLEKLSHIFNWNSRLFFTDQVPAAVRPHARGVDRASGDVATLAYGKGSRRACMRKRHLSVKDDVGCFARMRMIGIMRVRSILPDVRVKESFLMKLAFQRF